MAYGSTEWWVQHRDHSGNVLGEFKTANDIDIERNRNTPSSCTYQLARSDTKLTRDCFAPYRTDCFLYRGNDLIISGPHTSRKWSSESEGVIEVAMQDWMHLLEKLYMPIEVTADNMNIALRKLAWRQWPDATTPVAEEDRNGIALNVIVREMLAYRNAVDALQWNVEVMPSGGDIPTKAFAQMAGLDGKTMYDQIRALSAMHLGFDFDCKYAGTNRVDVRLWHNNDSSSFGGKPSNNQWVFNQGDQLVSFTWEDTGPKATRTYGTAQGHGPVGMLADVSTYLPSDETYRQLEVQEDVGEIADMYQYASSNDDYRAIKRLTGSLGHRNRGPVHQLAISFFTSIFPFNFWTRIEPGDAVFINYDFGFHRVNSQYIITGYTANINAQGDELITPDLEKVLDYTG